MLDIGWSEMAVIVLVAVVVIGPKDLPGTIRAIGAWLKKARQMSREFQTGFDEMLREADLDEARKAIDAARHRNLGKLIEDEVDPDGEIGRQFREMDKETRKPLPSSTQTAAETGDKPARNPVESVSTGSGEAPPSDQPASGGSTVAEPAADRPATDEPEPPRATYVRTPAQMAPASSVRPPEPAPKANPDR